MNKVYVEIIATGTQVYAYLIDEQILDALKNNCEDDSALNFIQDNAKAGFLVCHGADIDETETATIIVNDEKTETVALIYTYEDDGLEERLKYRKVKRDECLFASEDDNTELGEDTDLSSAEYLVLEMAEYRNGLLRGQLEVESENITASELSLIVCDMDVETELSAACYGLGLVDAEHDIQQLKCKGNKVDNFELDFQSADFRLVLLQKSESDEWSVSYEFEDILNS